MRILQIGTSYRFGGIESFLLNYNKNIRDKGVKFDFLVIDEGEEISNFYENLKKNDSKVIKCINYRKHPIKGFFEIKKIINDGNYNIVHYNMNSAVYLLPLIAAKASKAKVVIAHAHNSSSDKGVLKSMLHSINKNLIPIFANAFFSCSEKAGEWFFSKKILKSAKYNIIKNSIETNEFLFNQDIRKTTREKLHIKDDEILIGHVGRFNEQKNHYFLIEIFNELYKKNKRVKMILIGEGPLKCSVQEKIIKIKLEDKIKILGQRDDVKALLQAMDIFVLPSLYEGLPLVGVEAQASGVQCFFSDTTTKELKILDTVEFIGLNENARIWANKINKKIKNGFSSRDVKESMIESGYDIKTSAQSLCDIYNKLIKEDI